MASVITTKRLPDIEYESVIFSKRRRLDLGADPILYPHIPEAAQDIEQNRQFTVPEFWTDYLPLRRVESKQYILLLNRVLTLH